MLSADQIIHHFTLEPHPEGGFYKQTYKSHERIKAGQLPARFEGDRCFSTAIYYLLQQGDFSAFHRIKSDECWHFYTGQALLIYMLDTLGDLKMITLGPDISKGDYFQYVVQAGTWFASEPAPGSRFSFVGCTVAPGFEFDDFEMANANELTKKYPAYHTLINRLCR